MLVLNNAAVERLLTMPDMVDCLEEAFVDLAAGMAVERPRSHSYTPLAPDRYYLFKSMDGGLSRYRVHALRVSSDLVAEVERDGTWRREKIPAAPGGQWVGFVMLFSMDTLEPLALIQDGYLQRMRVGATSALAARCLVPDDVREAGLIGTGWQAGAQLLGLAVTRPGLERIDVYSRTAAHREAFCRAFATQVPFALTPVGSAEEALRGRRLWVLATNALEPVADGRWLGPDSHVNSIQGREVDDETVARATLVVVRHDARPSHHGPPGFDPREVRLSQERRLDIGGRTATLGDVLSGRVRRPAHGVTLFGGGGLGGSAGLGVQFAAVGRMLYDAARAAGEGIEADGAWFRERYTP